MGTYQPPGRPATGRAFGSAGSLQPGGMTGFDQRDATTNMQNDQRRESELYRRIFRQQSRASRKGDVDAGLGALQTLAASRAAGFDPTGISSAEGNRDFAAGSLSNLNEQTAMVEGDRQAAPVSGATGIPEVPGMQQAPPASLTDSFEAKAGKVMGSKLGSRPDADGSLFAKLTGVDPNAGTSQTPDTFTTNQTERGVTTLQDESGRTIGTGTPAGAERKPSLSEEFAKQFPLSAKLMGATLTQPKDDYDPSEDPEMQEFDDLVKKFGRKEALRMMGEKTSNRIADTNRSDREAFYGNQQQTLSSLADLRTSQREADKLYAGY